jgi:hypothetical protein
VLSGAGAADAAAPADATAAGATSAGGQRPMSVTPALAPAADSTTGSGLLAPLAGLALAAAMLLVVRALRRQRPRRV